MKWSDTGFVPPTPITAFPKEKLDRCGYLLAKQKAANAEPWREELSGLVAEIREHYKKSPADVPVRAAGALYYIDLTKREIKRTVSHKLRAFDALKKVMGLKPLIEALTISFKLLDAHVAPADQVSFVTQERTGTRDVTAVLIHAVEAKALKAA